MPLLGTLNTAALLDAAPKMSGFDAEPWAIEGVEILHLKFEIDDTDMQAPLPKALHPDHPARRHLHCRDVSRQPRRPLHTRAGARRLPRQRPPARFPRARLLRLRHRSRSPRVEMGLRRASR